MSIQKYVPEFEDGKLKHESKPYTQILNDVLQRCTNLRAIGLWCHLQSRPENWIISPQNIMNHFEIGKEQVYKILNYLIGAQLLVRNVRKRADGTHEGTDYILKNGTEFLNIQEDKNAHPLPGLPEAAQPDPVKPTTTNKRENTNKRKNINCASNDAHPTAFDQFWEIYPKKKDRKRAEEIWKRKKYDERATLIMEDVKNRIKNDQQWQDAQFIPHPTTYLRNERFNDEVSSKKPSGNASPQSVGRVEAHCTVPFWGPGHPGWESIHAGGSEH